MQAGATPSSGDRGRRAVARRGMSVLDALVLGQEIGGERGAGAVEQVWRALDTRGVHRRPLDRLHSFLAWLDRVEFWPEVRAALDQLRDDEEASEDPADLVRLFAGRSVSATIIPDGLRPDSSSVEQELAELIRAERVASVARDEPAAKAYLSFFDALVVGLERLREAPPPSHAATGVPLVATVTYLASHPGIEPPVPEPDLDRWHRRCWGDPELVRAFARAGRLHDQSGDDAQWLLAVLGCGFAWLPLSR